jgi:hypothetical protein
MWLVSLVARVEVDDVDVDDAVFVQVDVMDD